MKEELIIIGGGIAGVSCALYAKRAGLQPVIFEKSALGGQLNYINYVDNYPGVKLGTRGGEFLNILGSSLKELDIKVIEEEVTKVTQKEERINVYVNKGEYEAFSLVIATGASFRRLEVEGEEEFIGRGVSWCAVCDGYFFKGKEVVVVGGGNIAVEDALYLSSICKKIYLIHRRDKLRALDYLQKEVFKKENIKILWNSTVKKIRGKDFVEEVVIENNKENKIDTLKVNAVFIAIGITPNTQIYRGLIDMNEEGFIITDENMATSSPYIYACGDCRRRPLRQLITAAGEGAIAALSVYRQLKGSYVSY